MLKNDARKYMVIRIQFMTFVLMKGSLLRLDEFISSKQLIKETDTLLVAVSGGMDSMFLLNYLVNKNYKLAVAHCNFNLRGKESDGDEKLVQSFCEAREIKIHIKQFETEEYAATHGISIQMAARDLRYNWFNELCDEGKYTKIVTAHHKTDHTETVLLNITRGTGLKGLEGIPVVSGNKIRPLLCLSRDEISALVLKLKIDYREDSSNTSDKYHRNRIRLNVLPELKKINPDLDNTYLANSGIIEQANGFIHHFIETIKKEILTVNKNSVVIDSKELLKCTEPKFVLYSLLSDYGFNASTVQDIFEALKGISGKQFFSESHRLILNRRQIIIEPNQHHPFQSFVITKATESIETTHYHWHFEILKQGHIHSSSPNEALLDYDCINFPLTIRPWQNGDKIKPLGMTGHKKVSDILIDKKLSLFEKEKVWVVVTGNDIVWISGLIVSEDFKVHPGTKKVFVIMVKPL